MSRLSQVFFSILWVFFQFSLFPRFKIRSTNASFLFAVMHFVHCVETLQTLKKYEAQLVGDPIIKSHLKSLYDNLLEQNLCRIIEPFSRVQVEHVAKLVGLDVVSILHSTLCVTSRL